MSNWVDILILERERVSEGGSIRDEKDEEERKWGTFTLDDENNRAYRNIVYNMEQDGITQECRVMHSIFVEQYTFRGSNGGWKEGWMQ